MFDIRVYSFEYVILFPQEFNYTLVGSNIIRIILWGQTYNSILQEPEVRQNKSNYRLYDIQTIINKSFNGTTNIVVSSEAGQCNSLAVALCIAPPTNSCESGIKENKNKDKIVNITKKINNLQSGSFLFVAPGLPFVKDIIDYSDRVFGFQPLPTHNKFLHTPLCEPNCLKQNFQVLLDKLFLYFLS